MKPFNASILMAIITLAILLICSALLSGSEVAYFSLSPKDIKTIEEKDSKKGRLILKLLRGSEKLLATILIGNNFVNVGIVILSAYISESLIDYGSEPWVQFAFEVVGITALILFFGEIFPKVYAKRFALKFALTMATPLNVLKKIFTPISSMLVKSSSFVNKRIAKRQAKLSLDDLSHALEITSNEISDEKEILESIVRFGNTSADEIMTARVNVVDVDIKSELSKVLQLIIDESFSRMPVFENTPDNVKGVLYVKDLLPHINEDDNFEWQQFIREPYFVPETKKINDLLDEFKVNKIHMAIVVDEYGGTSGIVTLEDILEEIVGDIADEQDDEQSFYKKQDDGSYIFKGETLLNDFYRITNTNELYFAKVKGESETLAGLILELKGEIPDVKTKISFKGFLFTVEEVDSRRIIKVRFEDKTKNKSY